ncbi:hypothetical protein BU15DRAFT_69299, partial [Melanogaster broomeanus]
MPLHRVSDPFPPHLHARKAPAVQCMHVARTSYSISTALEFDLLTLVSSIRATIASHAFLAHAWPVGENGVVSRKDFIPDSEVLLDVVHVCTQERLDEIITTGSTSDALAPDCTRFYILVDADNRPSQLVFLGGPLFYNHTTLLHVLHLIDSCCRSSPINMFVTLQPLLLSASQDRARTLATLFPGQLKYEDVRLSMLNAWAVVLSYHAGSQDIVVAEGIVGLSCSRRIEFISATPAQDQLSIQMAQDPIHARVSWDVAKEVLGEAIHSIVEIINEPEFALFPANRRSLFRPFDTPLHLSVRYTTSGSLAFTLSFDPSAFDEQDVQCMLDHLLLAFQQLLTNPTLSRTEINLMSAKEHAFVQNLPSLITINRMIYPSCPGDIVGLFVPQSPMAVVVIYALLKVGAAYISIDIDTPTVLFRKTIDMTNSSLFLTVESLEQKLRAMCWGQAITTIDRVTAQWSTLDSTWQADQCPIGDPKTTIAYISLTSGSTGPPKKCMISHSNLVHWIVEAAPAFGRTTETRQLLAHELFWDGAVEEIFLTHYAGGTLCIAITHDIDSCLHDALVVTKATSLTLSPTQGMRLDPTAYPSLQVLVLTGEPLTRFVREKWLAYGKTLFNAFGPIETPVHSSASNETPVGFSIGGQTRLYILYPDMKLAPIG